MDATALAGQQSYARIDLPIGDCLGRGWDLALANLGPLIGYTLILLAVHVALAFIPIAGWIASWVIGPALSAGYFIYIFKKLRGEETRFDDFFGGLNYFGNLFLVGLIGGILIAVGLILCILPGLYLAVAYMFASFLVVARKLDFWQAMETSRRAVTDNLVSIIVLVLVLLGINILGLLACGVGLVLSITVTYCASVVAFRMIFPEAVEVPPIPESTPVRID
jgi:hypothetical protein